MSTLFPFFPPFHAQPFPSLPFIPACSFLPSCLLHIISFLIFVSCFTLNYTVLLRTYSTVLHCTFSECIRKEGWSDRVQLNRVADHFIFTVESSGCIPPEIIVREVFETASICLSSVCLSHCLTSFLHYMECGNLLHYSCPST